MKRPWYDTPRMPSHDRNGTRPTPWYNSVLVLMGLWVLTDQWSTFFGYWFIAEAFLWTLEHAGQWRDE